MSEPQIIEHDGTPAFAVLPIDAHRRLAECAADMADIQDFDQALGRTWRALSG